MILSEGLYLGLTFWVLSISAWSLSRIFLAMAVPSILVAVIAGIVLENGLDCVECGIEEREEEVAAEVGVRNPRPDDRP